jgi:serpin B
MKTKILAAIMVISFSISGCRNNNGTVPDPGNIVLTEKSLQLVKSDNSFSFNLLSNIPEDHSRNLMVSPLSVSLALSMTLNGANGETKTAMQNALGLQGLTQDEINQVYLDLVNALKKADPKVVLNIANSIWIRKGFPVLGSFTDVNKKYFDASVENLDFDQAALNIINSWVNNKTNGKIPTILDKISAEEIMFLINAIYFNGKWQYQFDPSKTSNSEFTLAGGQTVSAPMMKMKKKFAYSEQTGYKALKMPYGRGKFQMVALLPDQGNTPEAVAGQLDPTKWETLTASLANPVEIDVWFPKFQYSWDIELNQMLSSMGMAIAFSKTSADFSKINADQQIFITKVKHKTFIKVDEEGTEAAATTSVGIGETSMPANPLEFHANRPFLYVITEEDTGAILFIGKVENPLLSNRNNLMSYEAVRL